MADAAQESPTRDPRRRTFGPVVLLGVAGAGLAAIAGHERWISAQSCGRGATANLANGTDVGQAPVAGAVALVVLAAWGVLLVTRGPVRRVVAVIGAVAAVGLAVAVALGPGPARSSVTDYLTQFNIDCSATGFTGWYWVAVLAAVLALVPAVLAVRLVPAWPEMGTRYDAPTEKRTAEVAPLEEQENLELWKAINEGRDPTA